MSNCSYCSNTYKLITCIDILKKNLTLNENLTLTNGNNFKKGFNNEYYRLIYVCSLFETVSLSGYNSLISGNEDNILSEVQVRRGIQLFFPQYLSYF